MVRLRTAQRSGRMVVPEETHAHRSPLSGRVAVRNLPRVKTLGYSVLPFHGKSLSGSASRRLFTNHQSLITCGLLRHGVHRNPAALDHTSLSGPDPAPIFQGQQTDTHDDDLAGDKG